MYKRTGLILAALALFAGGYFAGAATQATRTNGTTAQAQANCQTFKETGKAACGRFLTYWLEHGGVAQQGFPISGELTEVSELNGKPYKVQYFERAVFEMHPENAAPYDVLLSQLGTFQYKRKYGGNPPPAGPSPSPAPSATPLPAAFVEVQEPVRRNGMTFVVTRVDFPGKQVNVNFSLTNNTGSSISFTLKNSDQRLIGGLGNDYGKIEPNRVITVNLANGQTYSGATGFNVDFNARPEKGLLYAIDNLPGIAAVRVKIPVGEPQ